jgi:hypothetical protein
MPRLAALALIASSLALSVFPAPVSAQDRAALRAACEADFGKHCPCIRPGGGRLVACFREKQADFSQACQAAFLKAQSARSGN